MPAPARYARGPMQSLRLMLAITLAAAIAPACTRPDDLPTADAKPPDLPDPPSASQIADARARLQAALAGGSEIRKVLERLGLLPTYTCGEPRSTFVGEAVG